MATDAPFQPFAEALGPVELVGLDADDTLWETEGNFQNIQARFEELMAPYLASDAVAAAHLDDVERRNLEVFGYGVKGFTLSMIETAIMLSDGAVGGDETDPAAGSSARLEAEVVVGCASGPLDGQVYLPDLFECLRCVLQPLRN